MFKQNFIQIQSHLSAFFLLLVIFSSCKSRSQQPSIPLIQQPDERSYYAALDDSIKADPQNPVYRYARAIGYQEKNRHKEAIVDLNIVVDYLKKKSPLIIVYRDTINLCMVLFNRAYCYDNADSVENSITDYRRLLLCNPNDFMYQIAIPRVYIHHKRYVEAKKEIDEILSKKPESERGLVYKGVLEYEMGDFEKSMASINLCLLKFPNSIEGLVTKAKILIKLGKVSESCLALEDANKKMNPGYFGGQLGYMHSFQDEIKTLQSSNCK